MRLNLRCSIALLLTLGPVAACVSAQQPLKILKVDPPNWWAQLPAPMLLVRGEGLTGVTASLSDPKLRIERTETSANGHWTFLWLANAPVSPETISLTLTRGAQTANFPYTFAAPRAVNDGVAGFSSSDVMYLIMTDRFADGDPTNDGVDAHSAAASPEAAAERAKPRGWHGGDLRGIQQHLEYLQQLGVTTIWPTPVYQNHSPEAYHGYHTTDYYAVDEHYGSLADLKSLAAALHARGMKLVLDTVPNHVGPFHPWIKDEPTPDWFHGTAAHHVETKYDFNYLVDPHSSQSDRDPIRNGWFVNLLPDMNTENPAVAQYLRQNAIWWIEETGADGLRIDTFAYVNRQFWHDYTQTLHQLFPHLTEVGEILHGDPKITSFFAGGRSYSAADGTIDTGLYTPFDFPSYFALVETLTGQKPMTALRDIFTSDWMYPHPERLVTLIGNHDTKRFLSQPGANSARLRMAFALLATMRGMPHLYYGDELAMAGGEDPDDRRDLPGGFTGDTANAFGTSGRSKAQEEMHEWVQNVFQLRSKSSALKAGDQENIYADKTAFAFTRREANSSNCMLTPFADRYLILANVDSTERDILVDTRGTSLEGCTNLTTVFGEGAASNGQNGLKISAGAESTVLFKVTR